MKRYDEVASTDELATGRIDAMQDTVGAIAWDAEGNLAAGVSRSADCPSLLSSLEMRARLMSL